MAYGEFATDKYTKACWLMNDTSGAGVTDETGNHNGTVTGTAIVPGYFGNARRMRVGQTADRIDIVAHADFNMAVATNYTWEFLYRPLAMTPEEAYVLGISVDSTGATIRFEVMFGTRTDKQTAGVSAAFRKDGNNYCSIYTANNTIAVNQWFYIVITYDASQSQINRLNIYINGQLQTGTRASAGTIVDLTANYVRLGRRQGASVQCFGDIDMIRYRSAYLASVREVWETYAKIQGTMITI